MKNWWSQGESNHAHKRFEIARSITLLSASTPPLTPPPGRLRLAYPATTTARAACARPQPRSRESRRPWLRLRSRPPALGRSQAARARELAHVSRAGRVGPGPSRTSSRDEVFAFSDSHGGGGGSDTIAAGASPRRSRRATGRIPGPSPMRIMTNTASTEIPRWKPSTPSSDSSWCLIALRTCPGDSRRIQSCTATTSSANVMGRPPAIWRGAPD